METRTGNRSGNLAGGSNHTLVKLNAAMATSENQNCKRQSEQLLHSISFTMRKYHDKHSLVQVKFYNNGSTQILVTWCLFSTLFWDGEV